MGHTLATVTNHFDRFVSHFTLFRRALRKTDQAALDRLLNEGRQHLPAAGYAANVLPEVTFLLCLLLEKHKQAERNESEFENLRIEFRSELKRLRSELEMEIAAAKTHALLTKKVYAKEP